MSEYEIEEWGFWIDGIGACNSSCDDEFILRPVWSENRLDDSSGQFIWRAFSVIDNL